MQKNAKKFVRLIESEYLRAVERHIRCPETSDFTLTLLLKTLNQKFSTMAYVISEDCVACGTCIDECPVGAISEGDIYSINPDECTECGTCADACPQGAISLG